MKHNRDKQSTSAELKTMVIRMLNELRERVGELGKKFNKET